MVYIQQRKHQYGSEQGKRTGMEVDKSQRPDKLAMPMRPDLHRWFRVGEANPREWLTWSQLAMMVSYLSTVFWMQEVMF